MDSWTVLGNGWFTVVMETFFPRTDRSIPASAAASDTAIAWYAWLLNQAVTLTEKQSEMNKDQETFQGNGLSDQPTPPLVQTWPADGLRSLRCSNVFAK